MGMWLTHELSCEKEAKFYHIYTSVFGGSIIYNLNNALVKSFEEM